MHRRFLSDPGFALPAAAAGANPFTEVRTRIGIASENLKRRRRSRPTLAENVHDADSPVPEVHLLSNGRYHVMITAAGSGASRWQDLALTRWQEDATRDHWGTFLYVRDLDAGSAGRRRPAAPNSTTTKPILPGSRRVSAPREKISVHMRVAVSSEDDVELRRLSISNLSGTPHPRSPLTLRWRCSTASMPPSSRHSTACSCRWKPCPPRRLLSARVVPGLRRSWPLFFHGMIVHETFLRGCDSRPTAPASWAAAERQPIQPP